jgi:cytochrome c553
MPRRRPHRLPPGLPLALALAAALALPAAAGEPPRDTMAQRMVACTLCHGAQGQATREGFFPRIAGKPAGYLYAQLLNFRDGRRHNAAMAELMAPLTDAYLREIAEHFAALDLPHPPTPALRATPEQAALGERLARRGDAARGLPACIACHGVRLTGRAPDVPGLLGLPPDYIAAQLGAWANGLRRAHAPDCMATVARRLAPGEVAALAQWLAAQPMPADARPEAATAATATPPLACGSAR